MRMPAVPSLRSAVDRLQYLKQRPLGYREPMEPVAITMAQPLVAELPDRIGIYVVELLACPFGSHLPHTPVEVRPCSVEIKSQYESSTRHGDMA